MDNGSGGEVVVVDSMPEAAVVLDQAMVAESEATLARLETAASVLSGDAPKSLNLKSGVELSNLVAKSRAIEKAIESGRKGAGKPFADVVKKINAVAKKHTDALAKARLAVVPMLNAWEEEAYDVEASEDLPNRRTRVTSTVTVKVTDAEAVPRKFLIVDKRAVQAALENGEAVPGAKLERKTSVGLTGK